MGERTAFHRLASVVQGNGLGAGGIENEFDEVVLTNAPRFCLEPAVRAQRPSEACRETPCRPERSPVSARFAIEALTKVHQRKTFSCGNERIDRYFRETVTQDIKRRHATCFVARDLEYESFAGIYTL